MVSGSVPSSSRIWLQGDWKAAVPAMLACGRRALLTHSLPSPRAGWSLVGLSGLSGEGDWWETCGLTFPKSPGSPETAF